MQTPDLPRVSAILRMSGLCADNDRVPQWALDRGSAVHAATALDDQGRLDESSVVPEIAGHLAAWRKFRREMSATPIEIEKAVKHSALGYRGTLDRVMAWGPDRWVVDIKCGATCAKWHHIQTMAYRMAYSADRSIRRACVHVTPDGEYRMHVHSDDVGNESTWIAALRVAQFKGGVE